MISYISQFADYVGIISAVIAAIAATLSWHQSKKDNKRKKQKIKIIIKIIGDKSQIELPIKISRGELSRGELLGWLGMLPMKKEGSRFELLYLSDPKFFDELERVLSSDKKETMVIKCRKNELDQFDMDALKEKGFIREISH